MCFAPQRRALFRHLNLQKWSEPLVFLTFWLRNVLRATTACTFSTSELPKVVRAWCVLYILTWKCASRHNGVHFFDISRHPWCFVHFDFEMCFAPQRRALFRHLNFQKWSERGVFCTFWFGNVLRATMACNFSSLLWPAGSAPAALASLLFDPPEPQAIGKIQWIATFLPFRASPSSFFLLFLFYSSLFWSFSSLCLCPTLLFICPYCLSILSAKLPSIRSGHVGLSGPFGLYFFIRLVILWGWRNTWQEILKECLAESCPHFLCKSAKNCLSRNPRKIVSQELLPESLQESYGYALQECLRRMSFDSSSKHCLRDLRHRSVLQGCFPSAFK